MRPKSSSLTLILRSSVARIVSSSIGISYCLPVRLSVIVTDSLPVATPLPSCCWVSVLMRFLSRGCRADRVLTLLPARGRRKRLLAGDDRHRDGDGDEQRADRHDTPLAARAVREFGPGQPA